MNAHTFQEWHTSWCDTVVATNAGFPFAAELISGGSDRALEVLVYGPAYFPLHH